MAKYIYAALGSLILALLIATLVYANKYHKAKAELAKTELALQVQNEAIKQQALDFENYKKSAQAVQKQIENRYQNITRKNNTCEAELESYKQVLDTFYTRGAK